jgi:hypothetical protein
MFKKFFIVSGVLILFLLMNILSVMAKERYVVTTQGYHDEYFVRLGDSGIAYNLYSAFSDQQFDDPSIEWYGDVGTGIGLSYINVSSTLLSVDKITINVKGLKANPDMSNEFNILTSGGYNTKNMRPKNMNDQLNIYHISCKFLPVSGVKKDDILKLSFNFTVNGKNTKTLNLIVN